MEITGFINMLLAVGAAIRFNRCSSEKGSTMPKDISILMCLNCGRYSVDKCVKHANDCGGEVIVEVRTEQVGVYCTSCGRIVETEPHRCSCGRAYFDPVYKQPTLSHMEAMIHLLIDALAKSQAGLELREMPYQEPPDLESEDKGK